MENKKLYMIGNAHIDPVWLWHWQDGFQEVKASFRSALDRMKEYDDFVFTASSAAFYEWIEQNDPDMFAEVQARVREKRWEIVGGWWVEPDTNLPCGESFARHALYSQRYFLDTFGVQCRTGYAIDSFGHSGSLPQILALSGMKRYVFLRPGPHEKTLPGKLFWWLGNAGSRVLCYRIPFEYCSWGKELSKHIARCAAEVHDELGAMCFYGVGNHGGGPTIENIESIHALNGQNGLELMLSSAECFFKDIENTPTKLPAVQGDLLHHAVGCYAAHASVKQWNRKTENRLLLCEKWMAAAQTLFPRPLVTGDLERAWKKVLFNQFHDILAGTSIAAAYEDVQNDYGYAMSVAAAGLNDALQALSWKIDIPFVKNQRQLVVYNSQARDARWPVIWECANVPDNLQVVDDQGRIVPYQRMQSGAAEGSHLNLCLMADLPAMGYRTYRYLPQDGYTCPNPMPGDDPYCLDNGKISVRFNRNTGFIDSLRLEGIDAELFLGSGAQAQLMRDPSDTWSHDLLGFDQYQGTMQLQSIARIADGPVFSTIRVVSVWEHTVLRQEFTVYHELPAVFVRAVVDFRQVQTVLKLRFPVNLPYEQIAAQAPFGFAQRSANGEEHPMHGWLDVAGVTPSQNGAIAGVAVLNDGKYSYSINEDGVYLTILRSPFYAHHDPFVVQDDMEYEPMDQGMHQFNYVLAPHAGYWQDSDIYHMAALLNQPPVALPETSHSGPLPQSSSFAKVDGNGVVLTAMKLAEDGSGDLIVHLDQITGRQESGTLHLPMLNRSVPFSLQPGQVMALRIPKDHEQSVYEVDFMETPLRDNEEPETL